MPVTVGIFINPGVVPAASEAALPRFNRSFEYDSVDDRYARFLLEEILPEVGRSLKLVQRRQRPRDRGRELRRHLRLQRGLGPARRLQPGVQHDRDLRGPARRPRLPDAGAQDRAQGLARLPAGRLGRPQHLRRRLVARQPGDALARFEFAGYDVKHVWGDGAHDGKHGGAILPDALRWLWRDYPAPVGSAGPSKQPLFATILLPGEPWREVARGQGPPAVDAPGRGRLRGRLAAAAAGRGRAALRLPRDARRARGRCLRARRPALRRAAGAQAHRGVGRERADEPRRGGRSRSTTSSVAAAARSTPPSRARRASCASRRRASSRPSPVPSPARAASRSSRPEPAAGRRRPEPLRFLVPAGAEGSRSSSRTSTCTWPRAPPRAVPGA